MAAAGKESENNKKTQSRKNTSDLIARASKRTTAASTATVTTSTTTATATDTATAGAEETLEGAGSVEVSGQCSHRKEEPPPLIAKEDRFFYTDTSFLGVSLPVSLRLAKLLKWDKHLRGRGSIPLRPGAVASSGNLTVYDILVEFSEYYKTRGQQPSPTSGKAKVEPPARLSFQEVNELNEDLEKFFNLALTNCLLYRCERQQQFVKGSSSASIGSLPPQKDFSRQEQFGAVHLLRLLVSMPELLASSYPQHLTMTSSSKERDSGILWGPVEKIQFHVTELLEFLNHNNSYFKDILRKAEV